MAATVTPGANLIVPVPKAMKNEQMLCAMKRETGDLMMSDKKEIAVVDAELVPVTPMSLIARAQESNASIEQMQQLFELQIRYEENEAKKAYNRAIAEFKTKNIRILKDTLVDFATSKGRTTYKHAKLGSVIGQIIDGLCECGLSHSWKTSQDGGKIKVTCRISHIDGHFEETPLEADADQSGGKNSIQAIGSTVSYLERYTLKAALGLAEEDDDGSKSEEVSIEYITEGNVMDLESLIAEVKADKGKFLEYISLKAKFMIEDIAGIPVELYGFSVKVLEGKRGK